MNSNLTKVTITSLIILLAGSLFWGFTERNSKNSLRADFDKELLKNEVLVSEKLSTEKERDKANQSAKDANVRSNELSKQIESVNLKLKENATELSSLKKENSGSRKKYNELMEVRKNLESQLTSLQKNRTTLEDESKNLNEQLAALRGENEQLREDLRINRISHFDKPLIEATRGSSNKLVVKASRVQKLRTTVAIDPNARELKFAVINPRGSTLTEKDGAIQSRALSSNASYQLVEVIFIPKKKLLPGLYQIEVVSGGIHVASLQVNLR